MRLEAQAVYNSLCFDSTALKALRRGGHSEKKITAGPNKAPGWFTHQRPIPRFILLSLGTDHQRIAKIDRENEVAPPARVAPSVGKVCSSSRLRDRILILSIAIQAMMEARAAKGLTQKDLAQKINEKPTVIQEYESGKAIPKDAVLAKLERVLEVKFRGG